MRNQVRKRGAAKKLKFPINTADKALARWAAAFVAKKIKSAPDIGWYRFLRDGWRQNITEWRTRYKIYLSSRAWELKRAEVLKRDACCVLCAATTRLQVHHTSYENVGREPLTDLQTLCRPCHERVHAEPQVVTLPVLPPPVPFVSQAKIAEQARLLDKTYARVAKKRQQRAEKKALREAAMASATRPRMVTLSPQIRRRPKPAEAIT